MKISEHIREAHSDQGQREAAKSYRKIAEVTARGVMNLSKEIRGRQEKDLADNIEAFLIQAPGRDQLAKNFNHAIPMLLFSVGFKDSQEGK